MPRWSSLLTALLIASSVSSAGPPDLKARVATLVRQLGDDDFDRREAAQNALVALGPDAVTALDAITRPTDPEVVDRVREVRRRIGGPVLALRELLEAHPNLPTGEFRDASAARIRKLVTDNPGPTGDYLLTLIADPKHALHEQAVGVFHRAWNRMSAGQVRTYLERTLRVEIAARSAYPRGVDAMIGVGYRFEHGWGEKPEGFGVTTETTQTLDGKPYGKPYRLSQTATNCTSAWVRTKDLPLGRHTLAAEVNFAVTHRGETLPGTVRSGDRVFEMLPADAPDDLAGKPDPKLEAQIRAALWVGETEEGKDEGEPARDWWRPQYTWKEKDGTPNALHLPHLRLEKPLPVDLAFDVLLRVGDAEYPADMLVKAKGETGNLGHVFVRDHRAVARGRSGFVEVRVVFRPSRAAALTCPKVTSYYPAEIVSAPVRMRVAPPR